VRLEFSKADRGKDGRYRPRWLRSRVCLAISPGKESSGIRTDLFLEGRCLQRSHEDKSVLAEYPGGASASPSSPLAFNKASVRNYPIQISVARHHPRSACLARSTLAWRALRRSRVFASNLAGQVDDYRAEQCPERLQRLRGTAALQVNHSQQAFS